MHLFQLRSIAYQAYRKQLIAAISTAISWPSYILIPKRLCLHYCFVVVAASSPFNAKNENSIKICE